MKKIKINDIVVNNNNLRFVLGIYDNTLPKTTQEEKIVPAVVVSGIEITPETTKMVDVPRPQIIKHLNMAPNAPNDYIEAQIKKEIENFKMSEIDVSEKIAYFKDKIY